ncbi:HNH endonuclease [Pedobacter sp. MC2016-15]|uniref:HNH endonuclease n=1 Tax=Pedobacter sp. MC2016-15 TaxID=2994473 RepID=UPI00224644ED|nr:HNH endonuclease [Pedobacter sp. MC2016-15]MCX2480976.1 HNH endonuclease [Pedobacter sp. MC2016-15]
MIKVRKRVIVPASLRHPLRNTYNGQDVQEALLEDSDRKCYICEQYVNKSFQVEHHMSQLQFPHLRYEWKNLFLSCAYCNSRKSARYDLLDPISNNIEVLITQQLDLKQKTVLLAGDESNPQIVSTINFLKKLFNGKNGLRDVRCKELYNDLLREYVLFLKFLLGYKQNKNYNNKQRVIDSLLLTKEFLAFKYWILKNDSASYAEFKDYLRFNKLFQ